MADPFCFQKRIKQPDLILAIPAQRDWSQRPFRDLSPSKARRHRHDVPLDLGSEVGQPQQSRELDRVDSDLPGQGDLGQIGVGGEARLEAECLFEMDLDARRGGLPNLLIEN